MRKEAQGQRCPVAAVRRSVGLKTVAVLIVSIGLAACSGEGPKEVVGTLGGGALGAVGAAAVTKGKSTKTRLAATAAGALLGAFLGREVGKSLDKADRLYAERAAAGALEGNRTGQAASWRNPDSGHHGTVTPTRTYAGDAGQPCREYQTAVTIDGRTTQGYGTACRQADGTWRLVN